MHVFDNVSYAKCLRVIGQLLEAERAANFKIEKNGQAYRLRMGQRAIRLEPADIARLDALAQKKRRNFSVAAVRSPKSLSQQLRALGALLDRIDLRGFRVIWKAGSAVLEYEQVNRERKRRVFSAEDLSQLSQHNSSLRSNRYLLPRLDI